MTHQESIREDIRLRWRRQFLLAKSVIAELAQWNVCQIGDYYLHTHPDLDTTVSRSHGRTLVLLGYLFDAVHHERGNADIIEDIERRASNFTDILIALKQFAGRYVLLLDDIHGLKVVQDALSLREVYYCTSPNAVVCGSQPSLLRQFSSPVLERTADPAILRFQNEMRSVRNGCLWVGDGTCFENIRHLLPNRYLDTRTLRTHRYWPNDPWKPLSLNEAVDRACTFLQGTIRAAVHRQPVMMAVTSGTDSRTLLAASKKLTGQIYYFVNQERDLTAASRDIRVPVEMFRHVGVPFHVHQVPEHIDVNFREVFLSNTLFASDRILPTIYNVYYREHSDKLNLLGVGEIGRALWGTEPRNLSAHYLAYTLRYKRSSYATNECQKWLNEVRPVARRYGIDLMTLLLWEQLLGNWGAVGNSESDIAIEEFDPYDSHYMYETLLAVDDSSVRHDRHLIFREMIRRMWPELLAFPFNPPETLREKATQLLKAGRVYTLLKRARYHWNFHRFRTQATT